MTSCQKTAFAPGLSGRADPLEVAQPILWLASDEVSFMTASVVMADGGTRV